MVTLLILILAAAIVGVWLVTRANTKRRTESELADAKADARQVIERLAGQVYNLTGTDPASRQALADAAERNNAAGGQIDQARTPAQARLAKQTALEGLYYIRAARTAMGLDPGPAIPELDGQRTAGAVTENREVDVDGRRVAASPGPSSRTPNYFPGGRVAGRPVPAGWYSEPWWHTALVTGAWSIGASLLFSSMFSGMSGVGYDAQAFENGYGDGYQDGLDAGQDQGDQFTDAGDQGYDQGYDGGGADQTYDGGFDGGYDGGFDGGFDSGF